MRRPQPRRRRGWLSVLGVSALVLACIVAGAAAFVVVAAPVDFIRERIAERVKVRSGLDLAIAGGASLSVFPTPTLSLADVSLSAPEQGAAPLLTAARLDAQVSLWSLLGSRPAVDELTVYGPVIEVSADVLERPPGRLRSRGETPSAPETAPQASSATEPRPDATPRGRPRLGAGTLRVVDGTVRYRDRHGETTELTAAQLTVSAETPSGTLAISGSAMVRGAPITVAGTITPADALPTGQPAQVAIKVSGPPFEGSYEGMLSLAGGLSLSGELKLQVPSVMALGTWIGRPLPQPEGGDSAALAANIQASRERVEVTDLRATLGSTILSGVLALETGGPRPRLTGNLETSEVDVGRLLLKSPARTADADGSSATGSSVSPPQPPIAQRTRRERERRDWSDEPLNVSMLSVLDVALGIAAQSITYKDLNTGPARLALALEGGTGRVRLEEVQLYGGRAHGLLTFDTSGDALVTGANVKLENVDLDPLLKDGVDFPWLEGRANLTVALAGQGGTTRQIVEGLNGKVELVSRDGAIGGFDVGKAVRTIQSARLPNLSFAPTEKTPYTELAGNFTVTNGVAANKDLRLASQHLNVKGEGTIDLGQRRIDYLMNTKLGAAPDPGATLKIGEIDVPLTITGPWDRPRVGIKGQEQLTGTIKQIGKNLKSQEVKDAIRGMLSGEGEKRVRPRDLINKLLKKD